MANHASANNRGPGEAVMWKNYISKTQACLVVEKPLTRQLSLHGSCYQACLEEDCLPFISPVNVQNCQDDQAWDGQRPVPAQHTQELNC